MSSRARKDLFKMVTTFSYNAVEKYVIELKKKNVWKRSRFKKVERFLEIFILQGVKS